MGILKTVPRGLRGGVLGRFGGLLGAERHPFNDVRQKYHVLQWLRNKTQVIRAKPKDSIHRFDLLMRFVDCSRSLYRLET